MNFKAILLGGLLALGAGEALADATEATPQRVGPVQNYGALGTSSGAVVSQTTGEQVMLRGMSLYWSDATGLQYYNDAVIKWAVDTLGIDVFRFAMGIQYYNSYGNAEDEMDEGYSYMGNSQTLLGYVDNMVTAAVENDVYIIIDWHSHRAEYETDSATYFFTTVAQKYANIPNVIFEIYNEPVYTSWSTITGYADTVLSAIRSYSSNLALVGTPSWSQLSDYGGLESYGNIGYVLHFYAASHSVSTYGSRATAAISSGYPVFITEWGTTSADGSTTVSESATEEWISFMEENQISNCNWSLRNYTSSVDDESSLSAMFDGDDFLTTAEELANATYTTSGTLVKTYLQTYRRDWADSLVADYSGNCKISNQTATTEDGTISDVLNSSCTYSSSNEDVVTISGTSLVIVGSGYAIITASDGSKFVVTIEAMPDQSVSGFVAFTCHYGGSCNQSKNIKDLDQDGTAMDVILSTTGKTAESATFTSVTSSDESIVKVKQATCSYKTYCGNYVDSTIWMYEFTGAYGSAEVTITAPAVIGYAAYSETITVTYDRAIQDMPYAFRKRTVSTGDTISGLLPDTTKYCAVTPTYTYNGAESTPYLTKSGTDGIAGSENAIVYITATAEETENCYALAGKSITVVIGDSSSAVNKDEYYEAVAAPISIAKVSVPFKAELQNSGVLLQVPTSGSVSWAVYSMVGRKMLGETRNFSSGTHYLSLESLPAGNYIMRVKQGAASLSFRYGKAN